MGDRRDPDRGRALDDVGDAVRACLAALDRYEYKYAALIGPPAPPSPRRPIPDRPETRWTTALDAARAHAGQVETLLAEQEAVWGRWREALAAWRRSVEQTPAAA